jgi:hypothetical protein
MSVVGFVIENFMLVTWVVLLSWKCFYSNCVCLFVWNYQEMNWRWTLKFGVLAQFIAFRMCTFLVRFYIVFGLNFNFVLHILAYNVRGTDTDMDITRVNTNDNNLRWMYPLVCVFQCEVLVLRSFTFILMMDEFSVCLDWRRVCQNHGRTVFCEGPKCSLYQNHGDSPWFCQFHCQFEHRLN